MGSILDVSASPLSPHRRAKSLDRRSTESSMTVSHQGHVPCLGGGRERPFPAGPMETGLLLLSSQPARRIWDTLRSGAGSGT